MWNLVHLWQCKKHASVSHSSTESKIISLDAVFKHGRNSRSRCLWVGFWSIAFFFQPNTVTPSACAENGETCSVTNNQANTPSKSRFKFNTRSLGFQCRLGFVIREILSFWRLASHFWRWGSGDQDDHQRLKTINETRIPEPIELHLIRYLTESTWTQKSKSNTLTRKTNSQTYWQRPFHTWWVEPSTPSVQHQQSETISKRMQEGTGEATIMAKWRPTMNLFSKTVARSSTARSSSALFCLYTKRFESRFPVWQKLSRAHCSFVLRPEGHAQKCVEQYCELANKKVEQLYKFTSSCLDDHQFKQEELGSVGELSDVCSQIVLTC